jgi:hypothetical protein
MKRLQLSADKFAAAISNGWQSRFDAATSNSELVEFQQLAAVTFIAILSNFLQQQARHPLAAFCKTAGDQKKDRFLATITCRQFV